MKEERFIRIMLLLIFTALVANLFSPLFQVKSARANWTAENSAPLVQEVARLAAATEGVAAANRRIAEAILAGSGQRR